MPPRRSSRTTRASAEPEQVAPASKRKRGSTAQPEEEAQEIETITKPPSRSRKPSSRASSVEAPSTRKTRTSRTSLEQVAEIEEVEEGTETEAAPAKKKPRKSKESVVEEDEDEEEEAQPRARRTTARKPPGSKRQNKIVSDDEQEVEEEAPKPASKGRRRGSAAPPSSSAKRTSVRRGGRQSILETDDEAPVEETPAATEAEDDELELAAPKGRKAPTRKASTFSVRGRKVSSSAKAKAKVDEPIAEASEPEPDAEPEVDDTTPKASRVAAEDATTSAPAANGTDGVEDDDDDMAEFESQFVQTPRKSKNNPRLQAVRGQQGGSASPVKSPTKSPFASTMPKRTLEKEEQSLLEPRTPRAPKTLSAMPASMMQNPDGKDGGAEEDKGPKKRLVIHKMALINFKSYAGRQEIGPFHKSFSAIVGPNGSGKSNTIDALLFVFGYRASKMRQGKLSELIHNSARYPDLDECSVEVHFREIVDLPGPDAYKVVPGSKLVVARTAYKNNSSKYTINGRASNFTEVQTLLKGRGIDLDHKRFLILQGEVESIAQMKPKAQTEHEDGLLEYLEDIIGTTRYKQPIDEALGEMERLTEERSEKLNRLRLVEREKNKLEEERRDALDYLRLVNEHVRAQSRLWQLYLWQCLVNDEKYLNSIRKLETELADEQERNKDDVAHVRLLEEHLAERERVYAEVKEAKDAATKDFAVHEKKAVGLEERRKNASGKANKMKKSLKEDEKARNEAERTIEDSSEKIEKNTATIEEKEAELKREEKALEAIMDSLKDKTQVFHDQIEEKQKELQPWNKKINDKKTAIDIAASERDLIKANAEAARHEIEQAQKVLEEAQGEHEEKLNELDSCKEQRNNLQRDRQVVQRKVQDARANYQEVQAKASSLRQRIDEAKASQAASTSQNRVLDSLTKLKQTGRIEGFHGRLGALGTIPDKYDVAVSTACGALHNMVVDTVEQGQACIAYLRQNNVGRASFMVLEKLPQDAHLQNVTTPEGAPRLFDLIKPKEPRFAPAFFKGVGNTLVANDLEQANRIAFSGPKRWRVVTLQGQLIEASGAMSGGGTHVSRGAMSSKLAAEAVQPEVLRTYERESEEAAQLREDASRKLRELEAEAEGIEQSGPKLDLAIDKLNMALDSVQRRIAEHEKRVKQLKIQHKPNPNDAARVKKLEQEIASSTAEMTSLQEKTSEIEDSIKSLQKKIEEIGGSRVLKQRSGIEGIKLHIKLANEEVTKAEVAKNKAERDLVKLTNAIEANQLALAEAERDLEELQGQLNENAEYLAELKQKVEAAQHAAENSKDDLDNLKAQLEERREGIQAFLTKEFELGNKLSETRKQAEENDKLLDHWKDQHDTLKLEEIDDDEDEEDKGEDGKGETTEVKPDPDAPMEEGEEHAEGEVKAEPTDEALIPKKKKARRHESSDELHTYSVEELMQFKKRELVADEQLLDEKVKNAKPNLGVLKEYKKREEEFLRRAKDLEAITADRDEQKARYEGLRKQRLDEFMAGFSLISLKLKEMYQMITLGGNAELELVDSMDPFSEGIIFSVMPPKKSWKNISNLSGGEKTLSSLALVFALHVFKPTPLYFMDEIDAALDFRNVSIVANYIKDRTKNAQFIIISLRNDMFELSHRLIGIYKTSNATQSISIDNHLLVGAPVPPMSLLAPQSTMPPSTMPSTAAPSAMSPGKVAA